jgi:hypothetical protein
LTPALQLPKLDQCPLLVYHYYSQSVQ